MRRVREPSSDKLAVHTLEYVSIPEASAGSSILLALSAQNVRRLGNLVKSAAADQKKNRNHGDSENNKSNTEVEETAVLFLESPRYVNVERNQELQNGTTALRSQRFPNC